MPKNKKQESSSSSSDSSSEEVQKPQVKGKAAAPAAAKKEEKKPAKKQESSDDSSSDEKPAPKKAAAAPAKKEEPKKAAKKKDSSDDSDSSSEEKPKKPAKKEEAKKPAKKDSSDSDSDDADEESEEKPAAKNDKKRKASDDDEEKPAAKKAKTDAGAVTTSSEQGGAAPAEGNRLFLGNLSFKIDDDAIRAFFKDAGELTDIHWVTDKQTGKFYGTGFVGFATAEEAKAAVAMNGQEVLGRPIKIDFAQSRGERTPNKGGFEKKPFDKSGAKPFEQRPPTPKPDGCTTVFLGNLSFKIDEAGVRSHFADCGEIASIRWVERDGQFKGCGFVEFASTDATDKAVALNGTDLLGRAVRVDYSAPKPAKQW